MRRVWTSCPRATCGLLLAPRAVVACRRGCVVQSAGGDVVVSQIKRALVFIDSQSWWPAIIIVTRYTETFNMIDVLLTPSSSSRAARGLGWHPPWLLGRTSSTSFSWSRAPKTGLTCGRLNAGLARSYRILLWASTRDSQKEQTLYTEWQSTLYKDL